MEFHIGAPPRTPFAASRRSPQGETRESNVTPCVPLRGRGPRSGEGVLEGKYRKDTQRQSRPPFGGQNGHGVSYRHSASYTLCRFAALPRKGKREIGTGKPLRHILLVSFRRFPPLVPSAPPFPQRSWGHYGRWVFRSFGVYDNSGGNPYNRACSLRPTGGFYGLIK